MHNHHSFDLQHVLHELQHHLPAQAPLKDFVHHNTLHAFQKEKFFQGIEKAAAIFGFRVSLSLREYRELYTQKKIREDILDRVIQKNGKALSEWKQKMISEDINTMIEPRVGKLRSEWKKQFKIDLDNAVHPLLFRIICSYLDQGISIWNFPVHHYGFLGSVRELEKNGLSSFFKTKHIRNILIEEGKPDLEKLLHRLVGNEELYAEYVYDQQFAHPGWSGLIGNLEIQPEGLLDQRKICLEDLILLETLLELDALEFHFGKSFEPLGSRVKSRPTPLFEKVEVTMANEVIRLWQEAFEWTYYDEVLGAMQNQPAFKNENKALEFQAVFCIDDRECSIRRHLEHENMLCKTYGTPGFFGVEFFFQPLGGKFLTKLCPAPVTPKYLIKEEESAAKLKKSVHLSKRSQTLIRGWIISQTVGFASAARLFMNLFKPSMSPAAASSFAHLHQLSKLTIECTDPSHTENGLQIGFTVEEMSNRVEGVLRSTGMVKDFAPLVYIVGHGASSVNNPHYSAYDCGACCGRPGSVNARVFCFMANHAQVRAKLRERGIDIPKSTQFIGAIHDTTRDEIMFYDEEHMHEQNKKAHLIYAKQFRHALDYNAKERSRRFESINTCCDEHKVHDRVKDRSVSLFEPRPELNHATNTLCIVGRRSLTEHLFLDRRAFMNSYDYIIDPEGKYLLNILNAAAPVCGGINLEYYFSRVDNFKLGAGTKLPHNVMGLFGVANGADGDLRPGLPSQMIEVHDPIRLMIIVEHFPDVVLKTIKSNPATYEWFINEWVHLTVIHPETKNLHYFRYGEFSPYEPLFKYAPVVPSVDKAIESSMENLPVYIIQ
jgi:hypothetical protein